MKTIKSIYIALFLTATALSASAQSASVNNVVAAYLDVKSALVNSDGSLAASKAKTLLTQISAVKPDVKQQATWSKLVGKLSADARHISEVTKVEQQRVSFAALSSNIYQLVKAVKPSTGALYVQYCPMKKASWLSNKKEIENPYYGDAMLTCGGVKETLAAK
ncbi:DUF3347 domain-containing protein [Mucilaginibacter antarcticus]|uniref:DUF3347 domain-containing protein n=1 Tax=Mucilaginibacter antarcticus TaxID=1855725 RepID=A0ABW5XN45_9SPHI